MQTWRGWAAEPLDPVTGVLVRGAPAVKGDGKRVEAYTGFKQRVADWTKRPSHRNSL